MTQIVTNRPDLHHIWNSFLPNSLFQGIRVRHIDAGPIAAACRDGKGLRSLPNPQPMIPFSVADGRITAVTFCGSGW